MTLNKVPIIDGSSELPIFLMMANPRRSDKGPRSTDFVVSGSGF
jgi:hypothetical protein